MSTLGWSLRTSSFLSLAGITTLAAGCSSPSRTATTSDPEADAGAGADSSMDTTVDDDIAIPSPSGMGAAAGCGTVLGAYRTVAVFSNGADTRSNLCTQQGQCEAGYKSAYGASLTCGTQSGLGQCGTGRDMRLRTDFGLAFQCVEFARRFLGQRYHRGSSLGLPCLGNGNAIDLWRTPSAYFREKYRNSESATPPRPDDIVVFYDAASGAFDQIGHVAVVRKVTADRVFVAQQNATGRALDANYPLSISIGSGGKVSLADAGGALNGMAVVGWIRNPDNDPFNCAADATCPDDYSCAQGKCVLCSAPESDANMCTRLGTTCGTLNATDLCGTARTVNCGICDSCPSNCSSHGTCNAGTCTCTTGFAGTACNTCDTGYAGYPNCQPSTCSGASSEACGNCGTRSRTCNAGVWTAWSACTGEGVCAPSDTQPCGAGGIQTCGNTCQWGTCSGGICAGGCDDGLACTTDTCDAGTCKHALANGRCVIANACYYDGDSNPADPCQGCITPTATTSWSARPEGATCDLSKSCQGGQCKPCGALGQVCCTATASKCAIGATCNGSNLCEADQAVSISMGGSNACALFRSGRVRCWGNTGAMLGTGQTSGSSAPAAPVSGLNDATKVVVGYYGACAIRATGNIVCWGSVAGNNSSAVPVVVPGLSTATDVAVGSSHVCARVAGGQVMCWGTSNSSGQLGDGTSIAHSAPAAVQNLTDAVSVASVGDTTCAVVLGGAVRCWGSNFFGALGNNTSSMASSNTPVAVSWLSDAIAVIPANAGYSTFVALRQFGYLVEWGGNRSAPVPVAGLAQAVGVGAGSRHRCAIVTGGSVQCVGTNTNGILGDGTFVSPATGQATSSRLLHGGLVANAVSIAANSHSTCIVLSNGAVYCTGEGSLMLGDGQQSSASLRNLFTPAVGILPVGSEDGQCADGVDNDGNGKTDLDDPACATDLGSAVGSNVGGFLWNGSQGNYNRGSCMSSGSYGGPDAVFTWTAPAGGTYTIDTAGSGMDTVLYALKGNLATGVELGCNDNGSTLSNGASSIDVQVVTGDKLAIVVDSKSFQQGKSAALNITQK